jgi:hypothetical protein
MRSSLRRATVIMILLAVFLAPGFLQARTSAWERVSVGGPVVEEGFFSMAWNLLASFWWNGAAVRPSGSRITAKNGPQLDPAGQPETGIPETGSTNDSDNGPQLDPAGTP